MKKKTDTERLKSCLDLLVDEYDHRYLTSDPVSLVHEYTSPNDREVAGFVVSALAYGAASQIQRSARAALLVMGQSPATYVRDLGCDEALLAFSSFRHRWTDGDDMAFLAWVAGKMLREFGSIGGCAASLNDGEESTVEGLMIRFSGWISGHRDGVFASVSARGHGYLVPSPINGSACKRLALFFRWMGRGPDGIDFGLWRWLDPKRLIIPVDRHIARMAARLGLTVRTTPDWRMAQDITASLRRLDPDDPLRYDFALVRPGITGGCCA